MTTLAFAAVAAVLGGSAFLLGLCLLHDINQPLTKPKRWRSKP